MNANVQVSDFGAMPSGEKVSAFTLTNAHGSFARVLNLGTIITELQVPDHNGKLGDVVLGFDQLDPYVKKHPYFGCTVGRVANRISHGRFVLNGKTYQLAQNEGENHLHGGGRGFDKVLWQGQPLTGASVKFTYTSPAGEEGYPGTLKVEVTLTLSDANELTIDYASTTDSPTIINLTNHSYFNLAGKGLVHDHELMISAAYYTPSNEALIPTGEVLPVKGTPLDFSFPQTIGSRIQQLPSKPAGYDHNYVINRAGKGLALAARVHEPVSGRVLEVQTTQPGVQLYTGNFLDGSLVGKGGIAYAQYSGFCLETQHYPDAINHPEFPSIILRPAQPYHHVTAFKFSTR